MNRKNQFAYYQQLTQNRLCPLSQAISNKTLLVNVLYVTHKIYQ